MPLSKIAPQASLLAADPAPEVDAALERRCIAFLHREAELLDAWQFDEWMQLLDPALIYRIPVRTTRLKKDGEGFSRTAFLLEDDLSSVRLRVKRLGSDFAWSENPRTRTRHMITNIRVAAAGTGECSVKSNVAVFCHRGDAPQPVVITGERQDRLVMGGDGPRLRQRTVLLDATVIGMDAFSIFI